MSLTRRDFVRLVGFAGAAGMLPRSVFAAQRVPGDFYELPQFGNARLLHITDVHAQLLPVYYREPNVNLGVGEAKGKAPHLVGKNLLDSFRVKPDSLEAHAFTYLDFEAASRTYFRLGIGGHFFMEIAKFRAARVLWAQVVRACGGSDEAAKLRVFAKSGLTNKTQFDPHVNMLRATTEAFSAVGERDDVRATMADIRAGMPEGVDYRIVYDPTQFVRASIKAVVTTLLEAVAFVVLVAVLMVRPTGILGESLGKARV